ncbi:MAG: hypothetical protein Q9159_005132 [Coniocarpon cinnabarinum]
MFRPILFAAVLEWCFALPQYGTDQAGPDNQALLGLTDGLNFAFTPSNTPQPFVIDVDPNFIAATTLKAELYRPSRNITQPDWTDGPPTRDVSTYTTTVEAGPNFTGPVHLHFAHHRSNRSNAIPLLLIHGWPSSFTEWDAVIDGLVSPQDSDSPAFHAVAPDIPGFGFSPAPTVPGFNARAAGIAMDNLMKQLDYSKYAIYVTDLGSSVGGWMVHDAADAVISRLTDFSIVSPTPSDLQRYAANQSTPEESTFLSQYMRFEANDTGYSAIHSTRPLAIAESLTDSPVGFMAWMWNLRHQASGAYVYGPEELINDAMMLYIQGTYGNLRSYKEWFSEGALNQASYLSSTVPTGVGHWHSGPRELNDPYGFAPASWIQRNANLTFFRDNDVGNHFPATSAPQQWLEVTREFFGNASISGVDSLSK